MNKRIAVEVVKETRKALLVQAGGRQGWIQRRWMDESGTVSVTTFEKAVQGVQDRAAAAAQERAFRDADYAVTVSRETEKAVGVEVTFWSGDGEQAVRRMLWFPKSRIGGGEGTAEIPGWLLIAKIDEAKAGFPPNACAFIDPSDEARLFSQPLVAA